MDRSSVRPAGRDAERGHRARTCSRRAALGAFGSAALAAVAGCTEHLPVDDGEEGPAFATWLPADPLATDPNTTVAVEDARALRTTLSRSHPRYQQYLGYWDQYGVQPHQLEARISVDSRNAFATLLTGSFVRDSVLEAWEVSEDATEERGDFVLGPTQAVNAEAVIISSEPGRYVDARRGDAERLGDAAERWARAIQDVAEADMAHLSAPEGRAYRTLALAVSVADGPEFSGTAYARYDSAGAAEGQGDQAWAGVQDAVDGSAQPQLVSTSVDGAVRELELEFGAIPF